MTGILFWWYVMFLRSWDAVMLSQAFPRTKTLSQNPFWWLNSDFPDIYWFQASWICCLSALPTLPTGILCSFTVKLFCLIHMWIGACDLFALRQYFFLFSVAWLIYVAFLGLNRMTVMLSEVCPLCSGQNSVSQCCTLSDISVQFLASEPFLSVWPHRIWYHTSAAQPLPRTHGNNPYLLLSIAPTFLVPCSAPCSPFSAFSAQQDHCFLQGPQLLASWWETALW